MTRNALSLVEAMLGVAVLAIAGIPLLSLLFQEQSMTLRGHLYYTALVAAREEIGDLRFLLASGAAPDSVAHDWKPLKGSSFERLAAVTTGDANIPYEAAQERLETKVTFEADAGRIKVGKIAVRYEKQGIGATGAGDGALFLAFTAEAPGPVKR